LTYVLDASALIAVIRREPGAEFVTPILSNSILSSVNMVEVGTRLIDIGYDPELALEELASLGVEVVPFDHKLAAEAARLRPITRAASLSLADRACLALAMREQATAVTADRAWTRVSLSCPIELIR
jgi:ribonuclease VapC